MAMLEVKGIYRNGKIELSETPSEVGESAEVIVTFIGVQASEQERKAAIERVVEDMREGLSLGGAPYPKREDLYDRVKRYTDGHA